MTRLRHPHSRLGNVTLSGRKDAPRAVYARILTAADKYGGKADVTLAAEIGRVVILVEDEGPGIPRSEREKVFEPFYRIGNARDPTTGGVGLGLSVARSSVWEQGGDISLSSRRGGGLTVRVELPLGLSLNSPSPREIRSRGSAGNTDPEGQSH